MKYLLAASVAFLVGSAAAEAAEPVYIITDLSKTHARKMSAASLQEERASADAYARASGLPVLKEGNVSEVRLWVSVATFDPSTNGIATVGYVLTHQNSTMCRIGYAGKSTVPRNGGCKQYAPQEDRDKTLADLVKLSAFSDSEIDCDVVDGAWVLIDAVSDGKRFALTASNPEVCDGDAAKLVAKLLRAVAAPKGVPLRK
jgi:hypothetical protein